MARAKKTSRRNTKKNKEGYFIVVILLLIMTGIAIYLSMHYNGIGECPVSGDIGREMLVKNDTAQKKGALKPAKNLSETGKNEKERERPGRETVSAGIASAEKKIFFDKSKVRLELPECSDSTYFVTNKIGRYSYLYSPSHKQSEWVAYCLTGKEVQVKGAERSNNFKEDVYVISKSWKSASLSDYKRSGYDRGHLLPSADRDDTPMENEETFLLSNVSPQKPQLNRNCWNDLEQQVRRWATKYDTVYVVTGGVLKSKSDKKPMKRIGEGVTVPNYFYKVVLTEYKGNYYSIGFIIPNIDDVNRNFRVYAVTVDSVENMAGYDFFPALPDEIEWKTESRLDKKFWF